MWRTTYGRKLDLSRHRKFDVSIQLHLDNPHVPATSHENFTENETIGRHSSVPRPFPIGEHRDRGTWGWPCIKTVVLLFPLWIFL